MSHTIEEIEWDWGATVPFPEIVVDAFERASLSWRSAHTTLKCDLHHPGNGLTGASLPAEQIRPR